MCRGLTAWRKRPSFSDSAIKKLAKVRVQDPVGIPELDSAPQPDIAWVKIRNYRDRHPLPAFADLLGVADHAS